MADSKREKTKYILAYAPIVPFAREITESVAKTLELNATIGFNSADQMQDQFDERTTLAGVVYYNVESEGTPLKLSMSIRFPSEFRTILPFLTENRLWLTRCSGRINEGRDRVTDQDKQQDIYIREGFLQLQHQIFTEWYHRLRNEFTTEYPEPNVEVFNVLHKAQDESCTVMNMHRLPSFLYNFIYLLPFLNIIRVSYSHLLLLIHISNRQIFCEERGCPSGGWCYGSSMALWLLLWDSMVSQVFGFIYKNDLL